LHGAHRETLTQMQLQIELDVIRKISHSRGLSAFHRNGTPWELLLLLAANEGESKLGVYNTLDRLETKYLGKSAMLKFLKDRRAEGLLTFDENEKRSSWHLSLCQEIHDSISETLRDRNHRLVEAFVEQSDDKALAQARTRPTLVWK